MSISAAITVALSLCLGAPDATDALRRYERVEVDTGPVYFHGWSRSRVDSVAARIPPALARVERSLGREIGHSFTTVLVRDPAELARIVEAFGGRGEVPGHVLGVALPGRRVIVVRGDILSRGDPTRSTSMTLVHELAHLVIHRRPDARIPRWLDEGIAMWVSGRTLTYHEEAEITVAARAGSLYRLATLEWAFPRHGAESTIAYRQSLLMVRYLVESEGEAALLRLLDELEAGQPLDAALHAATGRDSAEFERAFGAWAAQLHSLFGLTLAYLNIWALAGPLALVAVLRHWLRRRRQWQALAAAEEGGEPGEPGTEPQLR